MGAKDTQDGCLQQTSDRKYNVTGAQSLTSSAALPREETENMPPPTYTLTDGDTVQITLNQEYQSSFLQNIWHYKLKITGSISDGNAEVQSLLEAMENTVIDPAAGTKWEDVVGSTYRLWYLQGQIIAPTRRYFTTRTVDRMGTIVAATVPSNIAAVVGFQSNIVGRGRTGGKHFAGFAISELDGAKIKTTLQSKLLEIATRMISNVPTGIGGGIWEPILWSTHTLSDTAYPVAPLVHASVRTMRRRTLHVGQ